MRDLFNPELGCGIRELLFEPFTPMTKVFLERKIEEVLVNYEPRITLQNVAVDDDQDRNRLVVDIYFYVSRCSRSTSSANIFTEGKIINVK